MGKTNKCTVCSVTIWEEYSYYGEHMSLNGALVIEYICEQCLDLNKDKAKARGIKAPKKLQDKINKIFETESALEAHIQKQEKIDEMTRKWREKEKEFIKNYNSRGFK